MPDVEQVIVSAEQLSQLQQQDHLLLVDFWVPSCAPCRVVLPLLRQLTEHYASSVNLVTVNADEHPALVLQYGVRSVPAVLLFGGGRLLSRVSGVLSAAQLERWLRPFLPADALTGSGQSDACLDHSPDRPTDAGQRGLLQQRLQGLSSAEQRQPGIARLQSWLHLWQQLDHAGEALMPVRQALMQQQDQQALELLLLRLQQYGEADTRQMLVDLLNAMPDRGLANQYRRQWFRWLS